MQQWGYAGTGETMNENNMRVITTVDIITHRGRKHKCYWLVMWRMSQAINKINEISKLFALGTIYTDESVSGVIHGVAWRKP